MTNSPKNKDTPAPKVEMAEAGPPSPLTLGSRQFIALKVAPAEPSPAKLSVWEELFPNAEELTQVGVLRALPSLIVIFMQEAAEMATLSKPDKRAWVIRQAIEFLEFCASRSDAIDESQIEPIVSLVSNMVDVYKGIEKGHFDVGGVAEIAADALQIAAESCCRRPGARQARAARRKAEKRFEHKRKGNAAAVLKGDAKRKLPAISDRPPSA